MQIKNTWYFVFFGSLIMAVCLLNINCVSMHPSADGLRARTVIDPYNATAWYDLADCYLREGKYQMAVNEYKRALEFNPNFPEAHAGLGVAYGYLEIWVLAEQEVERALLLEPKVRKYKKQIAAIYNRLGSDHLGMYSITKAIDYFQKALILNKRSDEVRENLSIAYCIVGQELLAINKLETARAYYTKALALDKYSRSAADGLSKICCLMAQRAKSENQMAIAIAHYKKALYYNEDNKEARVQLEALR